MIKDIYLKKKLASNWFSSLQQIICDEFQRIEIDYGKKNKKKPKTFEIKNWTKSKLNNEGGGKFAVIKNSLIFDSVGVNFSEVSGRFEKKFSHKIFGANERNSYWASGISVVVHMKNPKIPAMHFNTRYIVTSKNWFGGGIDLTPSLKDDIEKKLFHKKIQLMCNKHDKNYYLKYKKWCDRYFYLPHRKETRGVGGIFFDYKKGNWVKNFNFVRDVGLCFLEISKQIIKKKLSQNWTVNQKNIQLLKRGRYVEFNLLYDRGTKFGLNTGGNIDAIFMSLPPTVKWK